MKALRQLGLLRFGVRKAAPADADHRVLTLFRNRAELKKAYGALQEEALRLKDLVKQQEGATQRVQALLSSLEGRLTSTETAYAALVFYQLRRLWQSGRDILSAFVADLVRRQEDHERRAHLAQYNRELFMRRQAARQELHGAEVAHEAAAEGLAKLRAQRARLTRVWHYFARRALDRSLADAAAQVAAASGVLEEHSRRLMAMEGESAPQFPGLSLAARRAINLAAIAYAEALCARLAQLGAPVVQLAREATARREVVDEYGTARECVLLMGQIARAQQLLQGREGLVEQISARIARLQPGVRYRGDGDSTPAADSLGAPADVPSVLAEDTWDLFRILLR